MDREKNLTRLIGHTERDGDCWVWTRYRDPDGYGRTSLAGRPAGAHRAIYELVVGPIPAGHHLHHECETKPCVNPTHLQPVTPGAHNRIRAAAQTHCKHGHEYDEKNTYRRPSGGRDCRKCIAARQRAYQKRKKGS